MSSFEIISPGNGEVFATRSYAATNEIHDTLDRSKKAFRDWRRTDLAERAEICTNAVKYLVDRAGNLGLELSLMMGRPIRYSSFEISSGFAERAEFMIKAAEEALKNYSTTSRDGFNRYISHEPLGPVLVLAPWNYPYLTSVNAIIPAIMAGNSVVLKHADQTAIVAERYQEAFDSAGLPAGVFQHIHANHDQVAEMIRTKIFQYVAFTGSVAGGAAIQSAIGSGFAGSGLELGGKDPAYVCKDADIESAIENLVDGSFFNSGQSCCGVERIYVDQDVYDDFVNGFAELTRKYVVGDPMKKTTTLGPMTRKKYAQEISEEIDRSVSYGAKKLITDEDFDSVQAPYLNPQVLINVNHDMQIMQKEIFGPVVGIMKVGNENEAIKLMNDSEYGLTASIWTSDQEKAIRIGDEIETGTWFMNRCDYLDPELAWTGVKNSGRGCTLSPLGYHYLTRPKSYHLKLL